MKRFSCITVITLLLTFCIHNTANAQFWKSIFGKKKKHKTEKKEENVVMPKPGPLKKKIEIHYPPSVRKSTYRIDVLAPLYIDDIAKTDKRLPEKSLTGIEFYEGIKLAADSINNFHYNIQIFVHDIGNINTSTEALISKHKLDSADLIIGAVQSRDVFLLAQYAKTHKVNFVSALSPSDAGIKDNPYFILPQPTLQVHCKYIMDYIQKKHPNSKINLLYRTSAVLEQNAYNYITGYDHPSSFNKILCNTVPDRQQLAKFLDSSQVNILVISVFDNGYADVLLKQVHNRFPNYKFEIYGMPSWKTLPSLKKADAYPNFIVYFTTPFYFNTGLPAAQSIERNFRRQYGNKPGEFVYRAYETLYWYAYLLNQYGTYFNERISDNSAALFTKYEIAPKFDKDLNYLYNENQHLYLYKYQSGSYIVEQ
jgi:hypothetical protein